MVIKMQNIWKKNTKLMLILLLDVFIISGATYAATTMYQSNTVGYDNTTSGLNSNNVQDALDEVYSAATDYTDVITRLSAVETSVSTIENNYLSNVYPVGSIYIGVSNTNPGTLFGGTWVSFGTGKTLVGIDSSQTEFDTVEETGGEKTHTLTVDEMPSHNHSFVTQTTDGIWEAFNQYHLGPYGDTYPKRPGFYRGSASIGGRGVYIGNEGGGDAHNNLQPYITVYMWKRTA